MKKHKRIRQSWDDQLLYFIVNTLLVFVLILVLYPIIYVISCSISSGDAVQSGQVLLWPVDFSLDGYKLVFNYASVWKGLKNSIIYTVGGTALNMVLTVLAAYPLARPRFQGRKLYMTFFLITMIFSAGIIPKYILMSNLHLTNTRWSVILTGGISVYNMIIVRTYFRSSIPSELYEAAYIDGASEFRCFRTIALPLSKSVLSVITLYYAVGHWNSYFTAMLYVRNPEKQPLQMVLRGILVASKLDLTQISDPEYLAAAVGMTEVLKFALIVVTAVPVILLYPLVQKYFQKGVMIGSVKG